MAHGARHAAVQQSLQVADGLPEAVLGDDGQPLAALVPGAEHGVALLQGGSHGLFADGVLPAAQGVDADLRVAVGRRAYIHQVDVLPGQKVVMIQVHIAVQPVLLLHPLGLARHNVHQRHDAAPLREGQVGLDMRMGNASRTHNGDTNHMLQSFPGTRPSLRPQPPVHSKKEGCSRYETGCSPSSACGTGLISRYSALG